MRKSSFRTAEPLWREVKAWLKSRGVAPVGAPFIRYCVIDMSKELVIQAAIPVAVPMAGEGRILGDALPAGRYAVALHRGNYRGLIAATGAMHAWAAAQGVAWQVAPEGEGERWAGRIEAYLVGAKQEKDSEFWQTELACLATEDAS